MINVCLACDNNYAKYAGVVIASVLVNANHDDELVFYVLDGGIEQDNKEKILSLKNIKDCQINFVEIDNNLFKDYMAIKTHSYLTIAAYYRLKITSILPSVSRVIYFDCDVVINSSLKSLFNKDLGDAPVAGVKDINKRMLKRNPHYVNSGMLVMDLDNMRKQNVEQAFLDYTLKNFETIKMGDQEIINEALKGKIKVVEDEWNVQSSNFTNRSSYTTIPRCIHFVSRQKPWHFGSFSWHKDYYFRYLQCTPWALSEEEKKYWYTKNKIASFFGYIKYRPLFWLRPRYYQALFCSYIKPLFVKEKSDVFVVFNTAGLGDVLLCNGLCQNIKKYYPSSKLVFVTDKPFKDAALYQEGVDSVLTIDKHKGIRGISDFIRDFPHLPPDACFLTYRNERNFFISKCIGAKKVLFYWKTRKGKIQSRHTNLLSLYIKNKVVDLPIKYNPPELPENLKTLLPAPENYVVFCPESKNPPKDLPVDYAIDLLKKLSKSYKVVCTGHGEKCRKYLDQLKTAGCDFIDLTDKTSISELAAVLKNAKCTVSVDTGPAHLSYAVDTPTIILFREVGPSKDWAPDKKLYPHTFVFENDVTTGQVYDTVLSLEKELSDACK